MRAPVTRRGFAKRQLDRVLVGISVLGLSISAASCQRRVVPAVQPVVGQLDQFNTPPWDGGWTVIGRRPGVARLAQTFTPLTSRLTSVEIDVMTGNRGRGGDLITVKIVEGNRVLATASRPVDEGFDGMLRFDFRAPGVSVTAGAPLQLQAEDTNKDVFGWRYGPNMYPGGVAYFNGTPWNDGVFDFRFRIYGY
jgi:hypothetical protein